MGQGLQRSNSPDNKGEPNLSCAVADTLSANPPCVLIRIAVGHPLHRAAFLALVAGPARRRHLGDGSRTGLPHAARADDRPVFEPSGCLANRSVQAAREALAADAELLVPLLGDPDPEVRQHAAHALAAALGRSEPVMESLHSRFEAEGDPAVRACLVPAMRRLAREDRAPATIDRMYAWRQDPSWPAEVRMCAALSWLCLTDGPVSDDPRPSRPGPVDDPRRRRG
ncbi:hypothetical protein ACIHEI_29650 [Kitasatospora sp. NPDC051984]|uniref:hypothetical protein n=1 Tax=Kitasatospora sp. NPDC051984 TaxID=3364059 RepID=UPI0037CADF75